MWAFSTGKSFRIAHLMLTKALDVVVKLPLVLLLLLPKGGDQPSALLASPFPLLPFFGVFIAHSWVR